MNIIYGDRAEHDVFLYVLINPFLLRNKLFKTPLGLTGKCIVAELKTELFFVVVDFFFFFVRGM